MEFWVFNGKVFGYLLKEFIMRSIYLWFFVVLVIGLRMFMWIWENLFLIGIGVSGAGV